MIDFKIDSLYSLSFKLALVEEIRTNPAEQVLHCKRAF